MFDIQFEFGSEAQEVGDEPEEIRLFRQQKFVLLQQFLMQIVN